MGEVAGFEVRVDFESPSMWLQIFVEHGEDAVLDFVLNRIGELVAVRAEDLDAIVLEGIV
ncbi:MAG: hypothetical protein R2748_16230 [Bryobacterales bacterium]